LTVHVGTSGWQYASWRGAFYPPDVAQRRWLEHYAERFACVEVNNTFYSLPTEETVRRWRESTPTDFRFVVKASRYLTHVRRLREPAGPVKLLLERVRPIRRRLAAVLVQLPPRFHAEPARLAAALRAFPRTLQIAVEFRDPTWFNDDVRDVLHQYGAALCIADHRGERAEPDWSTASWEYVRFHEGDADPHPCYRRETLDTAAERLAPRLHGGRDAFVFFNNDERACALHDASVFARACTVRGLPSTRTPDAGQFM